MKKIVKISFAAFAAASLFFACSKAEVAPSESTLSGEQVDPAVPEVMTISATLEDLTTRVGFLPVYDADGKTTRLTTTWSEGDKIRVYNHADRTQYEDFTLLPECAGQQSGTFTGTAVAGSSFDLEIVNGDISYATQPQPADGVTTDLKYLASMSDVADYTHVSFEEFSSVLAITCKLPSTEAAAGVKSIDFTASEDIFNSGKNLTITLTETGDADGDGILHLFATLPKGTTNVPAGTELMVRFNAPETEHTVYSRFLTMGATTFAAEKVNTLNINAEQSDQHAGISKGEGACDGSTAAKAYLIADGYQLAAVYDLATPGSTTYFKMIDDVDMNDISFTPINTGIDGFNQVVDFNGNNKTISKLSKNLFYVFKGSIYDLTLDHCTVANRGILAEYCQGGGNTLANIAITNGSVTVTSNNSGAIIGTINNGVGTAATLTDCTVSATNVKGAATVGGVIGYANATVSVSNCLYTGGTITGSGQYVGGFVASTGAYASTFTNCRVENATINVNGTEDARGGGFVGMENDLVVISGCTVGTSSQKVTINTKEPTNSKVINVGGFVGVCYGTITQNGDVRSQAYVKITSNNTLGIPLKIGGFVGYHSGNIFYSDAIIDMSNLKGQHIGGFAGYITTGAVSDTQNRTGYISNCNADGPVTGNNYTGGFIGYLEGAGKPLISNCRTSGTLTGQSGSGGFVGQSMTGAFTACFSTRTCTFTGSNNGGFAGQLHGGSMTSCSTSGSITAGSSSAGGLIGLITTNGASLFRCSSSTAITGNGASNGGLVGTIEKGTTTIRRCYATGDITTASSNVGGLVGNIQHASNALTVTIENCYANGSIIKSNQIRGGLIGVIGTVTSVTVSNCYASGTPAGSFRLGGLIGNINNTNTTVQNCAAWNSEVTPSDIASNKWSSGAIVGTAHPNCHLTNNYRNPDMSLSAYWVPAAGFNHPDVDGTTHPLTDSTGAEMTDTALASGQPHYPIYPYHGKVESGKTLSQLASTTLGWSSDVWNFTGDLPTLK